LRVYFVRRNLEWGDKEMAGVGRKKFKKKRRRETKGKSARSLKP